MNSNKNIKPYYLFDNLFNDSLFQNFAREPLQLYDKSKYHLVSKSKIAERGGTPKRKFRSVGGGPIQDAIYASEKLLSHLIEQTGMQIEATGQRGTYTYYVEENDYLDIHRDVNHCDLTLITCLSTTIPEGSAQGLLYLYSERLNESLKSIYADRSWGYRSICLKPGQSILLQGGIVPHGVNPIASKQQRIISALCYKRTA